MSMIFVIVLQNLNILNNWANILLLVTYAFYMDMHCFDFQLLQAHIKETHIQKRMKTTHNSQSEAELKEWGRAKERIA